MLSTSQIIRCSRRGVCLLASWRVSSCALGHSIVARPGAMAGPPGPMARRTYGALWGDGPCLCPRGRTALRPAGLGPGPQSWRVLLRPGASGGRRGQSRDRRRTGRRPPSSRSRTSSAGPFEEDIPSRAQSRIVRDPVVALQRCQGDDQCPAALGSYVEVIHRSGAGQGLGSDGETPLGPAPGRCLRRTRALKEKGAGARCGSEPFLSRDGASRCAPGIRRPAEARSFECPRGGPHPARSHCSTSRPSPAGRTGGGRTDQRRRHAPVGL